MAAYIECCRYSYHKQGVGTGLKLGTRGAGAQAGAPAFADVAAGAGPASAPQDAPAGPVFRAIIELDQTFMEVEGQKIDLLPGMSSEASVILGKQRLIEYVLQPLRGYRQDAFREK